MPILRSQLEEFDPNNIYDVLAQIRQETINELVTALQQSGRFSTGALSQSIDVDIAKKGAILEFNLLADDYWKFVDKGVDGWAHSYNAPFKFKKHNLNQLAMAKFIANRSIYQWKNPTGQVYFDAKAGLKGSKSFKKQKREQGYKTLAFLAGRRIAKQGIKPSHFYTNTIDDTWRLMFREKVSAALKKDVLVVFKDLVKDYGNNNK